MFRRGNVFWAQNNETGKQESLGTKIRSEAERLLNAKNEAQRLPAINLQIARAYLLASDPEMATRTWQYVMDAILRIHKQKPLKSHQNGKAGGHQEERQCMAALATERRWEVATKDKALDGLRQLPLLETRSQDLLAALNKGKVSTNIYLRRIHNFALGMNWLPVPIIPKKQWPKFSFKQKQAITLEDHKKIVARELNPERRAFYELAWQLGASQSDIAFLTAEDVNWEERAIVFSRKKTNERVVQFFDEETAVVLRGLPSEGPLFPYLRRVRAGDRATEFKQRCKGLDIEGVSLHCYRYAWARRAREAGMPIRFAQEALGHNSKAVHQAYASLPEVRVPSLTEYEKRRAMFKAGTVTEPIAEVVSA